MEAPPQFSGAPKKSKTGLVIGLIALGVVLCCCGVCGVGGYFFKDVFGKGVGMVGCSMAIDQQRDGLLAYAAKHGGKLPVAASWQDDIAPFVRKINGQDDSSQPIKIPSVRDSFCDKTGSTSISLNAAIAGKKLDDLKSPYETIALFEAPGTGRNRSAAWAEPPIAGSPILLKGRHRGWIRQPVKGEPSIRDEFGHVKPVPGARGGMVSIDSKDSSGS